VLSWQVQPLLATNAVVCVFLLRLR